MSEPVGSRASLPSKQQAILDVAVVMAALATIPLTLLQEHGVSSSALGATEWVVWGTFALEFLVFVASSPRTRVFRLSTVGKLAVVVLSFPPLPNFLALVSLARLLRLLRLTGVTARALSGLKEVLGRRGLVHVTAITILLVLAGGACLSILEPQTVKGGYGDGIWWAVVTVTTVGYGDISPTTLWGRLIAVALMLVGMGLMSTLAASITTHFVQQTSNTDMRDLTERLGRIERMLEQEREIKIGR
jgi:voltage-gated potassium channel